MRKKLLFTLMPVLAFMLLFFSQGKTSLAAPLEPLGGGEPQIETDDDVILGIELAAAGLSLEEIDQILTLNSQLRDAYARGASTKEMEQMVNAADQEVAKTRTSESSSHIASFRWIGRYCSSGASATFSSSRGLVLSRFTTLTPPTFHIRGAWNWRSKTHTYTTSQSELVLYHIVAANRPYNHVARCR